MPLTLKNIKGKDLTPDLLRRIAIKPEQLITITITTEPEAPLKQSAPEKKSRFGFLHSGTWENKTGETDIAENHDKYLYDVDSHNEA